MANSQNADFIPSLVTPYGSHSNNSCGYCKGLSEKQHTTWGMGTERLTVSDYQYLIDRGWRRSGTYCYKPLDEVTCCPCYTIRCDALKFHPTRSQKRVLKTMAKYLRLGEVDTRRSEGDAWRSDLKYPQLHKAGELTLNPQGDAPTAENSSLSAPGEENVECGVHSTSKHASSTACGDKDKQTKAKKEVRSPVHPSGDSTSSQQSSSPVKARARRWALKQQRLASRAAREKRSVADLMQEYQERRAKRMLKNQPKPLEEYLKVDQCKPFKHKLEIRLVRSSPRSDQFRASFEASHLVYQKYQMAVHGDKEDECTVSQFERFLVDSPLVPDTRQPESASILAPSFGSYHQQYWLDGKNLIAVGVIDLLPKCLSSVYFFYDPAYAFLNLGTYSALREIAFVRELIRSYGPDSPTPVDSYLRFDSYYMGYFIRSCPKMSYKARYHPSYLACPVSYAWIPIDECLKRLDCATDDKLTRFSADEIEDEYAIPANLSDIEVDSKVICRLRSEQRRRKKRRSTGAAQSSLERKTGAGEEEEREECEGDDDEIYGFPITLEMLTPYLRPNGRAILHEWTRLIGQRALSGHIQIIL
ncbi:unnamed protein product [Calicophoron daubneyi]|uniref:Arginyl-tRNA--protein transferase 1 n=1 Tax=Calicophoron daubneyi TaxID=300641 RepID=A0AAV2TCJ3_CALDB